MSKNYVIITDSNSETPLQFAKEHNIDFVPMPYTLDDEEIKYHLGEFTDFKEFYSKVRNGKIPQTSTYSPEYYIQKIKPYLEDGKDVLFLCFSSALSSSFSYIKVACDELREKYPDRKLIEVDSLRISAPMALMVIDAFTMAENGTELEELAEYLENNRLTYRVYFTVDDINHLKRTGRISAATAAVGSMLSVKPILHIDSEGRIVKYGSEKGRKKSIHKLVSLLEQDVINPAEQTFIIGHADDIDAANTLKHEIESKIQVKDIIVHDIGPVIGTHCGPGTLCLAFRGNPSIQTASN